MFKIDIQNYEEPKNEDIEKKGKSSKVAWLALLLMLCFTVANYSISHNKDSRGGESKKAPSILGAGKEMTEEEIKNSPKELVGISVPSSVTVNDGMAKVQIKNTGNTKYVPKITFKGKEIYRASRFLTPGEKLIAIVEFGKSTGDYMLVEALTEKMLSQGGVSFSVKSKLVFK